jgi:hypothetical protein
MFRPEQLYDRTRYYLHAVTVYDLHSTEATGLVSDYYSGLQFEPFLLQANIRRDRSSWARWIELCRELDQGYCIDFGRDGMVLQVPQAGRFYVPVVRWRFKPWRVGLFAPSLYRY